MPDHDKAGQGASEFRAFLRDLPDEIARARERGLPVELHLPEAPPLHVRRLMDTLGVPIVVDPGVVRPGARRVDRPVSELQHAAGRARTMGNFVGGIPETRGGGANGHIVEQDPVAAKPTRELGPPPDDCAAGGCVYERACALDGRCVVRDRQDGEELLAREALEPMDAGERKAPLAAGPGSPVEADETTAGDDRSPDPAASDARVGHGVARWDRESAILGVKAYVAANGRPPRQKDAVGNPQLPSSSVVRTLGWSWADLIENAGYDRPTRGRPKGPLSDDHRDAIREGMKRSREDQVPPVVREVQATWHVAVKGTGLRYRNSMEAYAAADEIEADGERVADQARFDGDEAKAEHATDASRELAAAVRIAARIAEQREGGTPRSDNAAIDEPEHEEPAPPERDQQPGSEATQGSPDGAPLPASGSARLSRSEDADPLSLEGLTLDEIIACGRIMENVGSAVWGLPRASRARVAEFVAAILDHAATGELGREERAT